MLANIIATADGRATIAGRTGPIANRADYELFHALRTRVDAVIVGAETVRVESYGPMDAPAVLVTRSARVPADVGLLKAPEQPRDRAHPVAGRRAAALRRAGQLPARPAWRRACAGCGPSTGSRSIDCEGGPQLFGDLLRAGLVDELHLVIAPKLVGGDDPVTLLRGAGARAAARPRAALAARVGRLPVHALQDFGKLTPRRVADAAPMPLNKYGVLVGRAVDCRREGGTDSPHYQVRIDAAGTSYRLAVNVLSQESPSELLYLADDDFRTRSPPRSAGLGAGWHDLPPRTGLDFIRGNLFDRAAMRPLPPDVSGPDNDLSDFLDHYVKRAIADPGALVYAFGERWGPESGKKDKIFGFKPGNGVHDIHMNQGNVERFRGDDGVWQDGGLLLRLNGRWVGHLPRLPEPGLAHRRRHRPRDRTEPPSSRSPAAPPSAIHIVSAMVNPVGGAPERETVLLLNASPHAVDLTGWTLVDRMKKACALPARPAGGRRRAERRAPQRRPARQQGRLDHAARPCRPEGRRCRLHRRAGARGGLDRHVLTPARARGQPRLGRAAGVSARCAWMGAAAETPAALPSRS